MTLHGFPLASVVHCESSVAHAATALLTGGGGIAGQNLVLNVYAYQKAFASSEYGLGSAIGVVMLLILLTVTLAYLRILRRQGEEL